MQGITEVAAQQRVALFARGTEETRVENDSSLQVTVVVAAAAAAAAAAISAASSDTLCHAARYAEGFRWCRGRYSLDHLI